MHQKLAYIYAASDKWAEAEREYRVYAGQAGQANLPVTTPTAQGYARLQQERLGRLGQRGHAPESWWAQSFAVAGDRDQAILWLQKAVANHDSELPYEIRNPMYDFLRSDPRYIEMMGGIGLPP